MISKQSVVTFTILLTSCLFTTTVIGQNLTFSSFTKSKKTLLSDVYVDYFKTFYCNAEYNPTTKLITVYPEGFDSTVMANRSKRIEYEHVVPAENFGRSFSEWRDGHPLCVMKGKPYKGRKCAEKANIAYQLMQADMYNLYPAIGSVNGLRSNKQFTALPPNIKSSFGICNFRIADNKAEPPDIAKGIVGRTHLYFEEVYYPRFKLSDKQRHLMIEWHLKYPVTEWECIRTYRIEKIQHSKNLITRAACVKAGLWPDVP